MDHIYIYIYINFESNRDRRVEEGWRKGRKKNFKYKDQQEVQFSCPPALPPSFFYVLFYFNLFYCINFISSRFKYRNYIFLLNFLELFNCKFAFEVYNGPLIDTQFTFGLNYIIGTFLFVFLEFHNAATPRNRARFLHLILL